MRQRVRLTESQLRGMIQEAIDEALNEIGDTDYGQYMLGRLYKRKYDPKETIKDYALDKTADKNYSPAFMNGYTDQMRLQHAIDDDKPMFEPVSTIKRNTDRYRGQLPSVKKQREEEEQQRAKGINQDRRMRYRMPR